MIDDADAGARSGDAPFARTYDFYKHMTGIALISIGGVFAFLTGDGPRLDMRRVVVVLVALGVSGVTSLLLAAYLTGLEVNAVARATVVRRIRLGGLVAVLSLAIGLGSFIQTFASAMFT